VTSKSKKWRIKKIANNARKNILAQDQESRKKVLHHLERLEINPFDCSIKKVAGKKNIYRGRIGHYRYYFRLTVTSKSIEILLFDTRGSIKQKNIQRMFDC
jgi:mRNA-degrading endonuclease RelE of RelBE toxin-antitoxin system